MRMSDLKIGQNFRLLTDDIVYRLDDVTSGVYWFSNDGTHYACYTNYYVEIV